MRFFERRERRIEGQELVIILNAIDKSFMTLEP